MKSASRQAEEVAALCRLSRKKYGRVLQSVVTRSVHNIMRKQGLSPYTAEVTVRPHLNGITNNCQAHVEIKTFFHGGSHTISNIVEGAVDLAKLLDQFRTFTAITPAYPKTAKL
jgi:hypothetical protein